MQDRDQTYSLLDLSQVNMLLEAGTRESIELFSEILELFEQESRTKLADLRAARDAANAESFGNAAHALAGSSANIGGHHVWQLAKKMEDLSKNGQAQAAYDKLSQLEADFATTLGQLQAYLKSYR